MTSATIRASNFNSLVLVLAQIYHLLLNSLVRSFLKPFSINFGRSSLLCDFNFDSFTFPKSYLYTHSTHPQMSFTLYLLGMLYSIKKIIMLLDFVE